MIHCKECVFCKDGKCRRHAPSVITLVEAREGMMTVTSKPWGGWPLVTPEDSCAEGES